MKKENNIGYILIVSIVVTILVALLVIINVNGPILKDNIKEKETTTTKTTTTTKIKVEDEVNAIYEVVESIYIEGEKETFNASIYKSDLGFQINYDKEFFTPEKTKNGVKFVNVDNKENYVNFEKIEESEYMKEIELEDLENPCEKNGYAYIHKYLKRENTYIRVTESFFNDAEYEGLRIRMDYMVNSLQITE